MCCCVTVLAANLIIYALYHATYSALCDCVQAGKFTLAEFLGFSEPELKQILLADPKIYTIGKLPYFS